MQRALPDVPADCPLRQREFEVLYLLTQGLTYKETAGELRIAVTTVRTHIHNAYKTLGVPDSTTATVKFMQQGWHRFAAATDLPPFATPYLDALDRHLADGDDIEAQQDLRIAGLGLVRRKTAVRDRDAFLDRVIDGLGLGIRSNGSNTRRAAS